MRELHNLSHTLDDTRKTCIRRCDFCSDIADVYSPSIWAGWYRGFYNQYKEITRMEMEKVNHFLHVEWDGDCHAFAMPSMIILR
jgi:beta-galactosidase